MPRALAAGPTALTAVANLPARRDTDWASPTPAGAPAFPSRRATVLSVWACCSGSIASSPTWDEFEARLAHRDLGDL